MLPATPSVGALSRIMKSCIVISTSDAEFSALALRGDLCENILEIAELGFGAVELAVRDPSAIDKRAINDALKRHGLAVAAIGTGQAYGQEGLSFADPDPMIRRRAVDRIKRQMDFAKEIGCPQVIIGLIRGVAGKREDLGEALAHFIECMHECADHDLDVALTVEPINRYETDLLNDVGSVCQAIDRINRPNVKMLVDTFHMNIEEVDLVKSIERASPYLAHVHVADSNRWAPGCGHIDFGPVIDVLRRLDYRGAVSAEILPKPSPCESVRLAMKFFRKIGI